MQCGSPPSSYGAVFQSETLGEEDNVVSPAAILCLLLFILNNVTYHKMADNLFPLDKPLRLLKG